MKQPSLWLQNSQSIILKSGIPGDLFVHGS